MQLFSTDFKAANLGLFTTSIIGTFFGNQALVKGSRSTDHGYLFCLLLIVVEMRVLFHRSEHQTRLQAVAQKSAS